MNIEQQANIIEKFTDIINDDRVALLEEKLHQRTRYLTVVLDDIHLSQNASAIIRTSECLGIQSLHSVQHRNKHKINRDVVKGAAKWTELDCYSENTGRKACIENLKQQDYKIAAMTLSEEAILLEELPVDKKLALCFGCEETGLSEEIEGAADYKVQIPIHGFTQSYNVSVSAGICLYYLINKIKDTEQDWQLKQEEKETLLIEWLSKSTPAGSSLLEKYKKEPV
ncbi:MAG: tRNA (guanosine(18)-2'-O)-methyltransferase [marine bacterium B5-7]|nr:MAG: tRNA (guanosine(18)-2'-O)-methyltransferase [marine bacterium B5-7]